MDNLGTSGAGAQSRLIESLLKRHAYPHPVSSIELVETHISWVILTGSFAYKIKKAVKLDFLDFSSLQRRRHFCEEELRLNQQWAPALYLEVVPIAGSFERPTVGGTGEAIEYAVKMLQFPQSAQLDQQLAAGLLKENDLYDLAETVAGYHQRATIIAYADDKESVMKVRAPMLDNFKSLQRAIDMNLLARVHDWTSRSLHDLKPLLIERRKKGFVRECHGDLHLRNLVRLSEGIVAFDGVEFSAELRHIDVISDVAFLAMDLVGSARQDLAFVLLNRYLECTGDYRGMAVFGLYFVYHCMIRAKVAAIRSAERPSDEERQSDIDALKHHLGVAARWIEQSEPLLVAMHGYSGSGKTWLSSQLMSQIPAIRVRSDIERKRLLGLAETGSSESQPGQGIYTDRARSGIYKRLMDTAGGLLQAGFNVIIDASFLRGADRQSAVSLAASLNVSLTFLETRADKSELIRRLRQRSTVGDDASEADVEVLQHQFDSSEPLSVAESERLIVISTEKDVDLDRVVKMLRSGDG